MNKSREKHNENRERNICEINKEDNVIQEAHVPRRSPDTIMNTFFFTI